MNITKRLAAHAAWLADGSPAGDDRRLAEHGGDMRVADLTCADLGVAVLRGADLRGADLRGADLRGADLSCADLRGAGLRGADLGGADLSCADLRGAGLSCADLRGAGLRGADLSCADLRSAVLVGADLRGADLGGADLHGARGIASAGPVGRERRIIYAVDHGDRVMVQAGCRWDTADAVVAAIEADYADAPALRDAYVMAVRWMVAQLEAQR